FIGIVCNPQKVLPKYLEKVFLSKWFNQTKDSLASDKAIQKSLNNDDIINIEIPIPPLEIQKKIVAILDTIEKAIEIQEKIIEKTKELKKAMMADLFKYGSPSFRKNRRLKKTEIGEIPEDWKVVRLGKVVENYDKKRIPLSEEIRKKRKGIYPYCGANGIIDYIDDYIFDGEYVLLAEDGGFFNRFEDSAYIMKGKFWVNNHAHILVGKENLITNYFLLYWLIYDDISKYVSGSTRQKLTQKIMNNILIPLPSLSEQKEIADILQTIDQKIEIEQRKKSLYEELFKTVLNKIMNQEIDVEKIEI
ncbi:MAG: restriction endonuclease subunit S, partial [candidate division WOR-3 bacterium]|nr:restriction endonuclease subunit S [candidate division WOR-3 bacterium]